MNELIIITLATFGVSSLLTTYDGPGELFLNMRKRFPNSPLECIVCTATWASLLFVPLMLLGFTYFLAPFAVVGVVILLERL